MLVKMRAQVFWMGLLDEVRILSALGTLEVEDMNWWPGGGCFPVTSTH